MTLPVDRLSTIIQAFTEEMSLIIQAYGGYILKYIGDAILAFFTVNIIDDPYLPCLNAINYARSMIKIVRQGLNPILDQNGYPELGVRIGIDVGDQNAVLQYGWDIIHTLDTNKHKQIIKKPHYDIIGYTISVAVKMTGLAKPNRFIIGPNFLTVSISCISCSFFTTLTSWSFLEQQVQFAASHSHSTADLVITASIITNR